MSSPLHSVHIYNETRDLILRLGETVRSSLAINDPVIIIATDEHHQQLTEALIQGGVYVSKFAHAGMYNALNAEEVLASFMVKDLPDPNSFRASFLALLSAVRERSAGEVTIFGEMVALLWERGNRLAALQIEELGNELLREIPCRIQCAYPKRLLHSQADDLSVCALHTHVTRSRAA